MTPPSQSSSPDDLYVEILRAQCTSLDEQNIMQQAYLRNIIGSRTLAEAQRYAKEAIERSR